MLVKFTAILYIFMPFIIFYLYLICFVVIWYISPRFGTLHQEKSGNPGDSGSQWFGGKKIAARDDNPSAADISSMYRLLAEHD
jgi:hypothetical protein